MPPGFSDKRKKFDIKVMGRVLHYEIINYFGIYRVLLKVTAYQTYVFTNETLVYYLEFKFSSLFLIRPYQVIRSTFRVRASFM